MTKLMKKLIVILCAVCLAFAAVACGGGDNNTSTGVDYTVTVECSDPVTLVTVKVKLLKEDGTAATEAKSLTDGSATFNLAAGVYYAEVTGLLEEYNVPAPNTVPLTPTSRTATVKLELKGSGGGSTKVEYKVKLTMPDGSPVRQTLVQLCGPVPGSGTCHSEPTGSDGYATFSLAPGTYEVHVAEELWPTGYTFDNTIYTVTAQDRELTVAFDQATQYHVAVMFPKGKNDEGEDVEQRPAASVTVTLDRRVGGQYVERYEQAITDATGVATLTAPAADYRVRLSDFPREYTYSAAYLDKSTTDKTIVLAELGMDIHHGIPVKAGEEITVNVTKKASEYYYLFDHQNKTGQYKVTSTGTLDTYAHRYNGNTASIQENDLRSDDDGYSRYDEDVSADNKNFYMEFGLDPASHSPNSVYVLKIGANVDAADRPASFKFKIEFVKEIIYSPPEDEYIQAEQIIDPKDMPAIPQDTTFTWVSLNGDDITLDEDTGYYRLNGNGPIIYVPVAENSKDPSESIYPRPLDTCFKSACDQSAQNGFIFSDGKTYSHNYSEFVESYNDAAPENGLHPLTTELKTFLQHYSINNYIYYILGWPLKDAENKINENLYYFACGYFKNIYTPLPEATGAEADPYVMETGKYKVPVAAGGSTYLSFTPKVAGDHDYRLAVSDGLEIYIKADGTYVKAEDDEPALAYGDEFYIKNTGSAAVTAVAEIYIATVTGTIRDVGTYDVLATGSGVKLTFKAPKTGRYTITSSDPDAVLMSITSNGSMVLQTEDEVEKINLNAGASFTFYCSSRDMMDKVLDVTIAESFELSVGDNTVNAAKSGAEYTFTATNNYTYTFSVLPTGKAEIVLSYGDGQTTTITSEGTLSANITLKKGDTVTAVCTPVDPNKETHAFKLKITIVF